MGGDGNAYTVLIRNKPHEKPRRREDITKTDLNEIGLEGTDWIHLVALVNTVMNFCNP
jgi:hypothetical protein